MGSATVAQLTYMGDGPGIVHGGTVPLVQKKPPLEKAVKLFFRSHLAAAAHHPLLYYSWPLSGRRILQQPEPQPRPHSRLMCADNMFLPPDVLLCGANHG